MANNTTPDGTLRGVPPTSQDGTLRGPSQGSSQDGTLRGVPPTSQDGTLRGPSQGSSQDGTLRGPAQYSSQDGTLRGPAQGPSQGGAGTGTLRGNPADAMVMDGAGTGTLRGNPAAGAGTGTLRGNPAAAKDGTLRGNPAGSKNRTAHANPARPARAAAPQAAPQGAPAPASITDAAFSSITLGGGVTYKVDGVISRSTGEAEIFLLSHSKKQYALKLYYEGVEPEHSVIDALRKSSGNGFLLDILDAGRWESKQGEKRFYELMPYYPGGALAPGALHGDAARLKSVAAAMFMALKACHEHHILHRDIKPGNFLIGADGSPVLCDFGISALFSTDRAGRMVPLRTRDQYRTRIYAAPETYIVIDKIIQYDDVKSDYFALGMTLLVLWGGETPFAGLEERALLRLKKRENGSIPFPDDLPKEMLRLIAGLTVPNPSLRWGFEEFERWVRGENVPVDGFDRLTGDAADDTPALRFVWSGSAGKVATSPQQLAQLLVDDKTLGKKYLYGGKISSALAQAGYPELQVQIDEFVNRTYPRNQEAGLMATAWLLDADMPFFAPTGKKLSSQSEIAKDIMLNASKYYPLVQDKDSLLYIYFRANGLDYSTFADVAKKDSIKALWRFVFTLDRSQPFPILDTVGNAYVLCKDVDTILNEFAKLPEGCYDGLGGYPALLTDDAFFMWLEHRDRALAGKVRGKLAGENNSKGQLYYYVMYLLDPERNFHCRPDKNKHFTIAQIADLLNEDYMMCKVKARVKGNASAYAKQQQRLDLLLNLKDNRLYYYLKSKEVYKAKFAYIEDCYNLGRADRKRQAGPYNRKIATFKAIKALSGGCRYYFPHSDKWVRNPDELSAIPMDEQLEELRNGDLKWWLAVHYQENPDADLSEVYNYEHLLADYTIAIGMIDSDDNQAMRTVDAINQVTDNAKSCRFVALQVKILRCLWGLLIALPLLAMAAAAWWPGFVSFPTSVSPWLIAGAILQGAVICRILQAIPFMGTFIRSLWGHKLADFWEDHRWLCSLAYSTAYIGTFYLLIILGPVVGRYVLPVLCLGQLWLLYDYAVNSMPLYEKAYDDCLHPDSESAVVEPLYYGWKDTDSGKAFNSETLERQDTFISATRRERLSLILRTLQSLVPVLLTVAIFAVVSVPGSEWVKAHHPHAWQAFYNSDIFSTKKDGSGDAADGVATTRYYADVRKKLNVRVAPNASSRSIGSYGKGEEMEVISISNGFAKIKYGDGVGYVNANYIKKVKN